MGGRPSREINPDPGPCPASKSDIDKRYHQQFIMRENSKKFNKYKEAVHNYREEKGIDWAVELQLDRQTKLDEWREYYIYEHRKRRALEKALDRAKRELEPAKERIMKAKQNGSVGVPETALLGRWGELIKYKRKIAQAQKEGGRVTLGCRKGHANGAGGGRSQIGAKKIGSREVG
ncbi:hypothetical protein K469DRAFT_707616 [Zopfia rhizophila CBS 207.26]|uniref:Uncharacterized protein n=1 Tax=Zopfia rhizophila CBS 207.26 TaxID=1314779 RepID=A0A6A6E6Y7_9PEZI|nr:hypothetical protein K469DRAFT_707616 [Zopfia rhizophila CBS 207.26]